MKNLRIHQPKARSFLMFAFLATIGLSASAWSAVPQMLHYQGYLQDAQGDAIDCPDAMACNGMQYDLTFRIYDEAVGGTPLWEESFEAVSIRKGVFDVLLGATNPIDAQSLKAGVVYLALSINQTAELEPRQAMAAAAFAIRAAHSESADNTDQLGGKAATDYVTTDQLNTVLSEKGLDDGDNDALAGLSCDVGNVAKFDGAVWDCTPDKDTDTLAGLMCGIGDVAKWNGTAWECKPDHNTDSLAGLPCVQGDLPQWNGVGWICVKDKDTFLSTEDVLQIVSDNNYVTGPDTKLSESDVLTIVTDNGFAKIAAVTALSTNLETLQTQLSAAEASLATVQTKLGNLEVTTSENSTAVTALQSALNAAQSEITTANGHITVLQDTVLALQKSIDDEKTRALAAEAANATAISDETTRAQIAEQANSTAIEGLNTTTGEHATQLADLDTGLQTAITDIGNLKTADTDLQNGLNAEVTRAKNAEAVNTAAIGDEVTRAKNAEQANAMAINSETARATAAEAANAKSIGNEVNRAINAEAVNAAAIVDEVKRAEAAEQINTTAIEGLSTSTDDQATQLADLDNGLQTAITDIDNLKFDDTTLQTSINAEVDRAKAAEAVNTGTIANEVTRAKNAEQANAGAIANEKTRAESAEAANTGAIANEVTRAKAAEQAIAGSATNNAQAIANEKARAEGAEAANASAIAAEKTRAEGAETVNSSAIANEKDRAEGAEAANASAIANEVTRAIAAEQSNAGSGTNNAQAIANEKDRAEDAEAVNASAIANEKDRAKGAEAVNASAIAAEKTRAKGAEAANASAITAEKTRAEAAEQANAGSGTNNAQAIADEVTRAKNAEAVNATAIVTEKTRATAAEGLISNKINTLDGQLNTLAKANLPCQNGQIPKNINGTWSCAAPNQLPVFGGNDGDCTEAEVGKMYFDASNDTLRVCNGITYRRLRVCDSSCPAPDNIACNTQPTNDCGDICPIAGTALNTDLCPAANSALCGLPIADPCANECNTGTAPNSAQCNPTTVVCGKPVEDNCGNACDNSMTGTFCESAGTSCVNGSCAAWGQTPDAPAPSCQSIKEVDPSAPSAKYWIALDTGGTQQIQCDMTTDGGGWTRMLYAKRGATLWNAWDTSYNSNGSYGRPLSDLTDDENGEDLEFVFKIDGNAYLRVFSDVHMRAWNPTACSEGPCSDAFDNGFAYRSVDSNEPPLVCPGSLVHYNENWNWSIASDTSGQCAHRGQPHTFLIHAAGSNSNSASKLYGLGYGVDNANWSWIEVYVRRLP